MTTVCFSRDFGEEDISERAAQTFAKFRGDAESDPILFWPSIPGELDALPSSSSTPSLSVSLREADISDAPRIAGLRDDFTTRKAQEWIDMHKSAKRPLWVGQISDHCIVGYVSLLGFSERQGWEQTAEIQLLVGPSWRGKRIGSKLLEHALDCAPSMGIEQLLTFVRMDDAVAQTLFRARRFEQWGGLPGVVRGPLGRPHDVMLLGRAIS
ncbi:MAG: GNAT family N-acetyltransferase [Burkholderiales bacterium]|jgi:L-amino acid N-acyltransferase YncA|nr:GNAT family N-acetyltransferase [Burkholderiales bacterium]